MSSRAVHLRQARHNEGLAKEFVRSGYRYRDWAITAAFYAALHYFEARLHDEPPFTHPLVNIRIFHTEGITDAPDTRGNYSPHRWRHELLESNCAAATAEAYRRLRAASELARYHHRSGREMLTTAHDYFSNATVDQCLDDFLEIVKAGLGVS